MLTGMTEPEQGGAFRILQSMIDSCTTGPTGPSGLVRAS
jgi:hypothetical protein